MIPLQTFDHGILHMIIGIPFAPFDSVPASGAAYHAGPAESGGARPDFSLLIRKTLRVFADAEDESPDRTVDRSCRSHIAETEFPLLSAVDVHLEIVQPVCGGSGKRNDLFRPGSDFPIVLARTQSVSVRCGDFPLRLSPPENGIAVFQPDTESGLPPPGYNRETIAGGDAEFKGSLLHFKENFSECKTPRSASRPEAAGEIPDHRLAVGHSVLRLAAPAVRSAQRGIDLPGDFPPAVILRRNDAGVLQHLTGTVAQLQIHAPDGMIPGQPDLQRDPAFAEQRQARALVVFDRDCVPAVQGGIKKKFQCVAAVDFPDLRRASLLIMDQFNAVAQPREIKNLPATQNRGENRQHEKQQQTHLRLLNSATRNRY